MKTEEINIAEILKDCPEGTKLYSPAFGELSLIDGDYKKDIHTIDMLGDIWNFYTDGRYSDASDECMLFPSKDQRDWSKFVKPPTVPFEINRMHGFTYYYINGTRYYNTTDDSVRGDDYNWENGNYFNTEEQAKYAAKKVKELLLSLRKEEGNE